MENSIAFVHYKTWLQEGNLKQLKEELAKLSPPDVAEVLDEASLQESSVIFRLIPTDQAALVFEHCTVDKQMELIQGLANEQLVHLLNSMSADDRTRLFEELPPEITKQALAVLNPQELKIARQLLGYPEGSAGRYMTPKYVSILPTYTASEALAHVQKQGTHEELLNVLYVVDEKGTLVNSIKLTSLVLAKSSETVASLVQSKPLLFILATDNRSDVVAAFEKYDVVALPVTNAQGRLLGVITVDDVLDVAEEEATEDIQKIGGMEALDAPYLSSGFFETLRKRMGWLSILFVGELLTASALGYFQDRIQKVVVLALFVPLIISSGGNSGSQAASLIIRSLTLREVTPADWWLVFRRELLSGLTMGLSLGAMGFVRVVGAVLLFWLVSGKLIYGEHYLLIGLTISLSLVGVVLYGTLCGSMLPFALRRLGFDPATASTPFVATLVDVSGIIIYFLVATRVLKGTVL